MNIQEVRKEYIRDVNRIPASTIPCLERPYGVHKWSDRYGNQGTEILSENHLRIRTIRAHGLFDTKDNESGIELANYFGQEGPSKRRIFVVVEPHLPENKRIQITDYLERCKTKELLENYIIMSLAVDHTTKTMHKVETVVAAAKRFGLRRRDLLVAIGNTMMTDAVGLAAAIYRGSTPWILIPTDLVGIIRAFVCDNRLSVHYISPGGTIYNNALALSHPPIATFYDPTLLYSHQKRRYKTLPGVGYQDIGGGKRRVILVR